MIRIPIAVIVDVDPDGNRVYVDIRDDDSGQILAEKIYVLDRESREVDDV